MIRRDDPRQLRLFESPSPINAGAGALNLEQKVRDAVNVMIRGCKLGRGEIARRMSDLTGKRVTTAMLNAYTAPSRRMHRFPLEFAPALERVTGSRALAALLAACGGGEVYYGAEALKARLGVLEMERQRMAEDIKALKARARSA